MVLIESRNHSTTFGAPSAYLIARVNCVQFELVHLGSYYGTASGFSSPRHLNSRRDHGHPETQSSETIFYRRCINSVTSAASFAAECHLISAILTGRGCRGVSGVGVKAAKASRHFSKCLKKIARASFSSRRCFSVEREREREKRLQ